MKRSPRYRSHTPLAARLKWLAVLLFSSAMFAFSAWTVIGAVTSGSIPEFARHSNAVLTSDGQTLAFGLTLAVWIGLGLFFAPPRWAR